LEDISRKGFTASYVYLSFYFLLPRLLNFVLLGLAFCFIAVKLFVHVSSPLPEALSFIINCLLGTTTFDHTLGMGLDASLGSYPSVPPTHEEPLLMEGAGHAKTESKDSFHSALEDPTHVEENQPPSSKRAKAMLFLKRSWTKVKVFPGKFTACFFAGMANEFGRHAADSVFPDDDTDCGGD
jgi:hypothetical protein